MTLRYLRSCKRIESIGMEISTPPEIALGVLGCVAGGKRGARCAAKIGNRIDAGRLARRGLLARLLLDRFIGLYF